MTKSDKQQPLVSVEELAGHLQDPNWIIVDCRFNLAQPDAGRQAYEGGHIPGAFYADLDRDLASPASVAGGGRHPLPSAEAFGRLMSGWGVVPTSRVVAYDDAGGAVAARLWWLLRWMGHCYAALLDGGLPAWRAAGLALSDKPVENNAANRRGDATAEPGRMPTIEARELQAGLANGRLLLLDARAPERYFGRQEFLDAVAGHVPGALNMPFEANLGSDGRFRPAAELRGHYQPAIGGRSPGEIVCMCGSGVTACHTLLALEIAGIEGAALYVGSWSDWISSAERPVATG